MLFRITVVYMAFRTDLELANRGRFAAVSLLLPKSVL